MVTLSIFPFFPSLFLSSSLVSLFMFLDGNQSVSECWARSWLPLGRASKDSAMVLWTRWASTQSTEGGRRSDRTRTDDLLEGHARGHTLVDNNIGPSQFRYLTGHSSPERSNGCAQLLQLRADAGVGSRNKSEGSGHAAMHAPHHGAGRTCPCDMELRLHRERTNGTCRCRSAATDLEPLLALPLLVSVACFA
jgi:hypothetical protein